MSTFVIISLIAKFGFCTSDILLAPLITFCKVHRIFKITIKCFANGINLIRSSFSKVEASSLAYIIHMKIFSHRMAYSYPLPHAQVKLTYKMILQTFTIFKTNS